MAFKIFRKNCCGLDVHKTWIYACIGMTDTNGRTEYRQSRFSTFNKGLQDLAGWLAKYECKEVCMESAGKYWIPVFNILEKTCWVTLAHPKYTKPQKGNKTDRKECLQHIDELDTHKKNVELEIFRLAEPYSAQLSLIRTAPGLSGDPMTAIAILSEIGADMSVFPSVKHLASWAGCCPRNDQSNGKVKSTRISRAGAYLKPILVQIANAVIKSDKYPECKERYRRLKARRGHKKAIIAICRMLLTAIWNILSKLEPYSAAGYIADKLTEHSVVITKAQGLELLRKRGYIFKDDLAADSG